LHNAEIRSPQPPRRVLPQALDRSPRGIQAGQASHAPFSRKLKRKAAAEADVEQARPFAQIEPRERCRDELAIAAVERSDHDDPAKPTARMRELPGDLSAEKRQETEQESLVHERHRAELPNPCLW
jgi:hypothetical protein